MSDILGNKRLANGVGFWPTPGRFVNKLCRGGSSRLRNPDTFLL